MGIVGRCFHSHSGIEEGPVFRDPAATLYMHWRRLALLRSMSTRGRSFHRNAEMRRVPDDHSWLVPKCILSIIQFLCNQAVDTARPVFRVLQSPGAVDGSRPGVNEAIDAQRKYSRDPTHGHGVCSSRSTPATNRNS